jgi:thiamine-phosphate pyrophosphorylase
VRNPVTEPCGTKLVIPSRLYAIVDVDVARQAGWAPRDLARAYLSGGARLLQIRAKHEASGAFLDLAAAIVEDARDADAIVIVNDRADLAVAARASGVHVGQDDLGPADVRQITGPHFLVGFSTHTTEQIKEAVDLPISYVAIGPVFGTATKATGYEPLGSRAVRNAARLASSRQLPVVAIGGITLDTASRVIEAGAASVAVIGDLLQKDPEMRVREYLSVLDRS